ncbi:MAG: sulfurtransferase TusA family protein [Clostridiales bacterium]|nr:sulfurtransferase TusA family protein [Candidatus Crickella merdequi]
MIDARGLSCPQPVIMVANAVKSGEAEYTVLVDGVTPKENVTRFAESKGYSVNCVEKDGEFTLTLTK